MLIETDKQLQQMDIPDATHVIASVGVGSWAQAVTMVSILTFTHEISQIMEKLFPHPEP